MSGLGFVQDVFNEISLERNPRMWQSTDVSEKATKRRLSFLMEFSECKFSPQLQSSKKPSGVAKNAMLAERFLDKATELSGFNALTAINQSLILCPSDAEATYLKAIETRAKILQKLGLYQQSLWDAEIAGNEAVKEKCTLALESTRGSDKEDDIPVGFCDGLQLSQDSCHGRYIVAQKDFAPGDLLAVEEPEVKMLAAAYTKSHCWHCMNRAQVVYPCPYCTGVVYCSPSCQKNAQESYHPYECGRSDLLFTSHIGVWILAFRAIASSTFKGRPHSYVTHVGEAWPHTSAPEIMKEALVAVFLTRYLLSGGYQCPEELSLALSVLDLMRAVTFNCHEVVAEAPLNSNVKAADLTSQLVCIGFALNPHLALFNHSCDPNYGRVWVKGGKRVLAFATRSIAKGEEVCDAYSGIYAKEPIEDRSLVHQRYRFTCRCPACDHNWPMYSQLPKTIKDKPLKTQILKLRTKKNGDMGQLLQLHVDLMARAQKTLKAPHAVLVELEEKVHNLLWARQLQKQTTALL